MKTLVWSFWMKFFKTRKSLTIRIKMAKFMIGYCLLHISYSLALGVPISVPSTYSDELEAALTGFKTEVKSVIDKSERVVTECDDLITILEYSGRSLQKEVSDIVNDTLREFGKDVNKLIANVDDDVSKCTALSSTIESRATDILVNTNTCVYEKLNHAQMFIDETISSVRYTTARLLSIQKMVEDNVNLTMKDEKMITVLKASMFLRKISSEPSRVASEISSVSSTTRLGISRINSLMISECVSDNAIASLINDSRVFYSRIKNCIAKLYFMDIDLLVNDLYFDM